MILVYLIIGITFLLTIKAFNDQTFLNRSIFHVDQIIRFKQRDRLISSGFIHADWIHFGMNMYVLYIFSDIVLLHIGSLSFTLLYLSSLIGGNLLALLMHKNESNYRALGASGAVSGIVFTSIILYPFGKMGLLFIPFMIPSWLFGLLYIVFTIYAAKKNMGNIGHSAHLGGAIIGLIGAVVLVPQAIADHPLIYFLILIPCVIFLFVEAKVHTVLKLGGNPFKSRSLEDRHHRGTDYNPKIAKQKELDQLLDKVAKKGYEGLTKEERARLDELSK